MNGKADSGPEHVSVYCTIEKHHQIKEVIEVSKAGVEKVVNAMADESFRRKVKENPDTALAAYDLTPEERAAIKSGNAAKLRELGVDERITKSAVDFFGPAGREGA